jgi:hypothetical protein
MAQFVDSSAYKAALSVINALAARRSLASLREDVVAEAQCRLLQVVAGGVEIANVAGYAKHVALSALRRLRGKVVTVSVAPDLFAAEDSRPTYDELVRRPGIPLFAFRGATQRRIVAAVVEGHGHEQIAEGLAQSPKLLRRQIIRLARALAQ